MVSTLDRLPLPGHGDTWERFEILASLAEEDLSLARLGEGHADALGILDESGRGVRHDWGELWRVGRSNRIGQCNRHSGGWWLETRRTETLLLG